MLYTIKKGAHYPTPNDFAFHRGISSLNKSITFNSNCIYNFGNNDDNDINKGYGFTTDLFGKNSVRIGWNIFSAKTGVQSLKLWGYVHVNGKRVQPTPGFSKEHMIGKYFSCDFPIECSVYIENGFAYFKASQGSYKGELPIVKIPFPKSAGMGYYQYPYFGGTSSCPHVMNIDLI